MNLVDQINQSPYDFYFLVVDEMLDIHLPELTNFISISPTLLNIKIAEKNSGRLLSHPATIKFIQEHSATTGRTPAIIPFKPSAKIDTICQQNNWLCVSNPAKLNRLLEDKIKFFNLCSDLPLIPSLILKFNQLNYQQAQKQFGQKLVLQTHFGWAGNSSYISLDYSDVCAQISPEVVVKFSPYLSGFSLINNCCLTSSDLIQSPPGLQYTGISSLTDNPLATVGRQWPSFTPPNIDSQIEKITSDFSEILQKYHYRGFFGLDFFVNQDQVYLLECNPRLTASFAFYTTLEKRCQLTPLFFFHLAEFIGLKTEESTHFFAPIIGSEIVNRSKAKKYQSFNAFSTSADPLKIDPQVISQVL